MEEGGPGNSAAARGDSVSAARRGCSAFQVNLAGIDEGLEGPSAARTMVSSIVREENDRCLRWALLAVNTRLTPLCTLTARLSSCVQFYK